VPIQEIQKRLFLVVPHQSSYQAGAIGCVGWGDEFNIAVMQGISLPLDLVVSFTFLGAAMLIEISAGQLHANQGLRTKTTF